jgi:phosphohistidine phosphatase
MKTLLLLRHAKSSWDDATLSDFERPLNQRGLWTAPFMGELIKRRGLSPDVIVSSPAERAKETASIVRASAGIAPEIDFDSRIYEAGPNDLRMVVSGLDEKYRSAMLVGHNPGIEAFIYFLTGHPERMPTAAMALIELDMDKWNEIAQNIGRLVSVIRPKDEMRGSPE